MAVPPGGYAWWYLDALSDPQPDGSEHLLAAIAFIGSVFSPYYAWARRRQGDTQAPADAHCALNLSLYSRASGARRFQRRWAMTERGASALQRNTGQLHIGPSALAWQPDGSLLITVNEWTAPWPRRLRGQLRLQPGAMPGCAFALDNGGRHLWQPISPQARLSVDLDAPGLNWQGNAYVDANWGTRPLACDFDSWHWQRSNPTGTAAHILYDVQPRQGAAQALALSLQADGSLRHLPLPPRQPLKASSWGLDRHSRGSRAPALLASLESGPFYCRSLLLDRDSGAHAVHESLSLRRFTQPWVQALLPFRMPRFAAYSAPTIAGGR